MRVVRGRRESMLWGSILPAEDPRALADFYARLLGWVIASDEPGWVRLQPPGGGTAYLGFQRADGPAAPPWPPPAGQTAQVMQFDLAGADQGEAIEYAVSLGARVAEEQPEPNVTILLDPAGHPFAFTSSGG